jgi:hypothetical protein
MFDQKPNDRRKVQGVLSRLSKERKTLDLLAGKYHAKYELANLEEYADLVSDALENTPSKFINYKTANQAHRAGK